MFIFFRVICACLLIAVEINSSEIAKDFSDFESSYQNLKRLHSFNEGGWYLNGPRLEELIRDRKVNTIIEIGCWLGLSTRHMASLLPSGGKVYAVDHWKGSAEHQIGEGCFSLVLFHLYERFLSNVIHAQLTDKIIPIRMDSLSAAKLFAELKPFEKFDLIYIDASHDYESVISDIRAWYPFVKGHGILCGDDWHHPPIVQAVSEFANENGLTIEIGCNCWSLHEP